MFCCQAKISLQLPLQRVFEYCKDRSHESIDAACKLDGTDKFSNSNPWVRIENAFSIEVLFFSIAKQSLSIFAVFRCDVQSTLS